MGSAVVASWIANAAFWALLLLGRGSGALGLKPSAIFLLLWLAALLGLPHVPYEPARAMFSSAVAVLDIALVFIIFKGDVRIT